MPSQYLNCWSVLPNNPIRTLLSSFLHLGVGAILPLVSTVSTFVLSAGYVLRAVWELARCALRFGWALLLPKAMLAARVLAAESQLAVGLSRSGGSKRRRHRFTPALRLLWVVPSKLLDGREDLVHLIKPDAGVEDP